MTENLTQEDVLVLMDNFPITPLKNKVIITVNVFDEEGGINTNMGMDEVQYVLSVGSFVKDVKPGDKILLDLEKMIRMVDADENGSERVAKIAVRPVEVDGRFYAMIPDVYIDAIDNR